MGLAANYNTGFLTTGRSNWQIQGKRQWKVETEGNVKGACCLCCCWKVKGNASVKFEIEERASGKGVGSNWKCHTLASSDDGKDVVIEVYSNYLEICSNSGKSETTFNPKNHYVGISIF